MFGETSKLMNYFVKQVGLISDVAASAGSAMARLAYLCENNTKYPFFTPSDEVQAIAATERTITASNGTFTGPHKSITSPINGYIKVSWEHACTANYSTSVKIYKNGVATTLTSGRASTAYATFTGNLSVSLGDTIELWVSRVDASANPKIKNFKLCYSYNIAPAAPAVGLD